MQYEPWPYVVQVPMTDGGWRTVGSFSYSAEAQEYARQLVSFRVLRASETGGWQLIVCHTAA